MKRQVVIVLIAIFSSRLSAQSFFKQEDSDAMDSQQYKWGGGNFRGECDFKKLWIGFGMDVPVSFCNLVDTVPIHAGYKSSNYLGSDFTSFLQYNLDEENSVRVEFNTCKRGKQYSKTVNFSYYSSSNEELKYYYRHFIRYYDFAITYRRNFDLDYTYFKLFVEGGLVNSIYRSSEVGYLDYYSTGGTGSVIQSRWNKVGTLSNVSKIRSGLLAGGGIDLRIFNHFGTSITTLYDQGLTKVLDYKGQAVFINNIHLKWTVFLFFLSVYALNDVYMICHAK